MAGRRRVKPSYDVTHFLMLPTNAVTHLIHLCGHPLLPRGHAQVKGVTVHDLGSIYREVLARCCLREFKMSNSVASENVFLIGNGRLLEMARCRFPFIFVSCLASNGSSISYSTECPTWAPLTRSRIGLGSSKSEEGGGRMRGSVFASLKSNASPSNQFYQETPRGPGVSRPQ